MFQISRGTRGKTHPVCHPAALVGASQRALCWDTLDIVSSSLFRLRLAGFLAGFRLEGVQLTPALGAPGEGAAGLQSVYCTGLGMAPSPTAVPYHDPPRDLCPVCRAEGGVRCFSCGPVTPPRRCPCLLCGQLPETRVGCGRWLPASPGPRPRFISEGSAPAACVPTG